ncbi:Hypothetical_protein [Hexamita inflata]|uniref:Hypothetical_protein n=1 Tax=Hexamita inflata TaxID=28002 RepID=A0AA86TEG5_9EUKA|nr:Hypothetical protein HINF_LOCUS1637 [Hexamita inflata]
MCPSTFYFESCVGLVQIEPQLTLYPQKVELLGSHRFQGLTMLLFEDSLHLLDKELKQLDKLQFEGTQKLTSMNGMYVGTQNGVLIKVSISSENKIVILQQTQLKNRAIMHIQPLKDQILIIFEKNNQILYTNDTFKVLKAFRLNLKCSNENILVEGQEIIIL